MSIRICDRRKTKGGDSIYQFDILLLSPRTGANTCTVCEDKRNE